MIVDFDSLEGLRGQVALVGGGFDPLHMGHVLYFQKAAELGAPVFCSVDPDAYVEAKHKVLLPQEVRCGLIDQLKGVDYVHPARGTTAEVLEAVRPRFYVKGDDWKDRLPAEEVEICGRHGIEIVFLPTVIDSSSARVRALAGDLAGQVAGYEAFVQGQKTTAAEVYDATYFHDEWRPDGSYTVEARRKQEGRNPELIRDVFQASSVLDMGCGPGALMYLLHELGVKADGVDYAAASKDLAPPEVRDRIHIGSVVDVDLPSDAYELVICREVFEHLTVLEVQRAVQNICRITSRYVYLTTRFHPAPASLFDVTTEFHVDPTHITLMHIQMLRLMFVLQGFSRRQDLEARMDWLNKGRVLVYEKGS